MKRYDRYGSGVDQRHNFFWVLEICKYVGDNKLLEINVLDLVPSFSWKHKYFQTLISSCKVAVMIPDWLLIVASVILVYSPCIASVVSVCSLVGPNWSLVWCDIITSSWCGRLYCGLCIAVCVDKSHISVMISLLFRFSTCLCVLGIDCFMFDQPLHLYANTCSWYFLFPVLWMTDFVHSV